MTRNAAATQRNGPLATDPEIEQLLHPSRFYARPADVVADQLLTVDERRAILSSWASDACAVDSYPALRQPPHAKTPVTFDDIMHALLQLDCLKDLREGLASFGGEDRVPELALCNASALPMRLLSSAAQVE